MWNTKNEKSNAIRTFQKGRVEGGLTVGGGAEEVYAEWVMRAVHAGWTARENLWNLAPLKRFKCPFQNS